MSRFDELNGGVALVVDGSEDRRTVLRGWLTNAGMDVLEASDGTTALELAKQLPDVAIVDVHLPDVSGLEITAALKLDPLTQQIPVIQRSSVDIDETAQADGLAAGADAYLVEPVGAAMVLATAASLLRYRDLAQQLEVALSLGTSGVFDWAIPTGRVRWSASLEHIHGLRPGGFGGTFDDFAATIHPDDRERVANEISVAVAEGTSYRVSYQFVRADGTTGWIEGQGRVFRDREGRAVRLLGVAHDVTNQIRERFRLEQLRRLASRLAHARTTRQVLEVSRRELDGSDVLIEFGGADRPGRPDATFTHVVGPNRLELTVGAVVGEPVTRHQIVAIGELAASALDRTHRYEVERTNAIALQRALQPRLRPEVSGWAIDAEYLPASADDRLGGDFYDVIELDGRFVLVVGDVAGHGLDAGRQVGNVRTMLRVLAASGIDDPSVVLSQARAIFDTVCGTDAPFATAIVVTFDHGHGTMRIASAGHPGPLLHCGGSTAQVELAPGPPLGVESAGPDSETTVEIGAADWIAFFTDGVFEQRGRPLDDSLAEAAGHLGPSATAADVLASGELLVEPLNTDDRAVVVARRTDGVEHRRP